MFSGYLKSLSMKLSLRVLIAKSKYFHIFHLLTVLNMNIENLIYPMNRAYKGLTY